MLRPACAVLSLIVLAACEPGVGSEPPLVDPSPAANLEESITEPTDGMLNEVEAE